jgi:periplasmic protein CpxP/Spy
MFNFQSCFGRPSRLLLAGLVVATLSAVALPAMADEPDELAGWLDGAGPGGMRGHMMGGGPGMGAGHGAHMAGRGIERLLDLVNASADQRTRIKGIMQSAHNDLKTQQQNGQALRDQQRSIFAQPNIDARAAEAVRAQMSAQRDAASKRMLQARLEVAGVLTAEQRRTLADKMAQRRAMAERHRAERQAMERK